jgi:hypothetical protein
MNVSRLVASIGGYFYSTGPDVLAVHLYGGSTANVRVGGTQVRIRQQTDYPWSGRVTITMDPSSPMRFALKLRIPSWVRTAAVTVNGQTIDADARDRGYVEIRREWVAGDTVGLDLPMPVERVYADPRIKMDVGRVSLKRGPLVYCLEQIDNSGAAVGMLRLPRDGKAEPAERPDLFDGIVTIVADAEATCTEECDRELYRRLPPRHAPTTLTAVPYYIWNNRGPNRMIVWIPEAHTMANG